MSYLADAQFQGLESLWQRLCAGDLPARCTKEWYFETFCGVSRADFAARKLHRLGSQTDIKAHLDGQVKPCTPRQRALDRGRGKLAVAVSISLWRHPR